MIKFILVFFLSFPARACLYEEAVNKYSELYNYNVEFVMSVIQAESAFDCFAVSNKGAKGLMQLMDFNAKKYDVSNAFNAKENVKGGIKLLNELFLKFADIDLVLSAYNAGENAVNKYNGVPPYRETQQYIKKIKRFFLKRTGDELTILSAKNKVIEDPNSPWIRFRVVSSWQKFGL
jgi:soluble lytic murein transglycosylase-like protein